MAKTSLPSKGITAGTPAIPLATVTGSSLLFFRCSPCTIISNASSLHHLLCPAFALPLHIAIHFAVTEEFNLKIDTLCLAVNYVDRYLSCVHVQRNRLQLVGVTCMLIASYV